MPAKRSQRALDWLTFFAADVQTGFGPFIAVYLTARSWTATEIGFALSVGTFAAMLSQLPAGALVDATPHKRVAALAALIAIALSALLLALWPSRWPVLASEVLHGFASCVLVPALAAISLAMVGRKDLSKRLGRNGRYASLGNAAAAALLGLTGAYVSGAAVFWLTAALTLPAAVGKVGCASSWLSRGSLSSPRAAACSLSPMPRCCPWPAPAWPTRPASVPT
jgi:MFS family permease